jgi:hypothetical protein
MTLPNATSFIQSPCAAKPSDDERRLTSQLEPFTLKHIGATQARDFPSVRSRLHCRGSHVCARCAVSRCVARSDGGLVREAPVGCDWLTGQVRGRWRDESAVEDRDDTGRTPILRRVLADAPTRPTSRIKSNARLERGERAWDQKQQQRPRPIHLAEPPAIHELHAVHGVPLLLILAPSLLAQASQSPPSR